MQQPQSEQTTQREASECAQLQEEHVTPLVEVNVSKETELNEEPVSPQSTSDVILTPNEKEKCSEESISNGEEAFQPIDSFLSHILTRVPLSEDSNIPCNSYSETDGSTINVRGKTYLSDKVKVRSKPNSLKLCGIEIVKSSESLMHIMSHPDFKPRLFLQQKNAPFLIVINLIVWADHMFHFSLFFELPNKPNENTPDYIYEQIITFICGSDEYRAPRLKVMGVCSIGSWFIKKLVGNVPAILCNKITTTFHKGPNYFEIDVDVNSSRVATSMFSKIRNAFRSLCIDLHFWLEGKTPSELPEQIWTGVRIYYIDMEKLIRESLSVRSWTEVNKVPKSIGSDTNKTEETKDNVNGESPVGENSANAITANVFEPSAKECEEMPLQRKSVPPEISNELAEKELHEELSDQTSSREKRSLSDPVVVPLKQL